MNIYEVIFTLMWLISGVLTYGILFAFFQRRYPLISERDYKIDMTISFAMGLLLGPVGLGCVLIAVKYNKHGPKFYGLKFW